VSPSILGGRRAGQVLTAPLSGGAQPVSQAATVPLPGGGRRASLAATAPLLRGAQPVSQAATVPIPGGAQPGVAPPARQQSASAFPEIHGRRPEPLGMPLAVIARRPLGRGHSPGPWDP
jgi:hypothetical protein